MLKDQVAMKLIGGSWYPILLQEIQKDDIFRIYDENGEPIERKGCTVFKATEDAYINEEENIIVHSAPAKILNNK